MVGSGQIKVMFAFAGEREPTMSVRTLRVMLPATTPEETVYRVGVWRDPAVEENGWPVTSDIVERFWLPVLGPTSLLLLRLLCRAAVEAGNHHNGPAELSHVELSSRLGLSPGRTGSVHNTRLGGALVRLSDFRAATIGGPDLMVRCVLPPPSPYQVTRWHPRLAAEFTNWALAGIRGSTGGAS